MPSGRWLKTPASSCRLETPDKCRPAHDTGHSKTTKYLKQREKENYG